MAGRRNEALWTFRNQADGTCGNQGESKKKLQARADGKRILVAVKSCHKYSRRADAQRDTWIADVGEAADVRFFLGAREGYVPRPDEICLPVSDEYAALPHKTRGICRWATDHQYDWLFTCDDDCYVVPERLFDSGFERHDYVGRFRGPSGGYPAPYCSGFAYWLSSRAARVVAAQPLTSDTADDRWIGNVLLQAGIRGALDERYRVIKCDESLIAGNKGNPREDSMVGNSLAAHGLTGMADHRYAIVASPSGKNTPSTFEGPMEGNDIIAACEFEPETMHRVHRQYTWGKAKPAPQLPRGPLSNVSILIKTFLRDGYLFKCIAGLQKALPEAKIVVVDDGEESREKLMLQCRLRAAGHVYHWLPKDSGFGAKANAAIPFFDRPYVLIGSDDFDFEGQGVRRGIERMVAVLDNDREIAIASGRVNNQPYEMLLELGDDFAKECKGYRENRRAKGVDYQICDLTVNYSLIRREVFEKVRWDDDVKIGGGEHGAFFIDVKRAGFKVAVVSGASIRELPANASWRHRDYLTLRGRARDAERPCYIRRGIKHFLTASGSCEMCGPECERLKELVAQ